MGAQDTKTPLPEPLQSVKTAMQRKHGLRYDAEWLRVVTAKTEEAAAQSGDSGGTLAVKPEWKDVFELRAFSESMLGAMFRAAPWPEEVTETKIELPRPDGTGEEGTFTLSRFATAVHMAPLGEGEGLRSAVLVSTNGKMRSGRVETMHV